MKKETVNRYLTDLSSDNPRVKYPAAKKLIAISTRDPRSLLPRLPFFLKLLGSDNNILKWTAIDVVGNLSCIARKGRVQKLLTRVAGFLRSGKLITANHATAALAHLAHARPEYQKRITRELLRVEHYTYDTKECRNIALGQVILGLGMYLKDSDHDDRVLKFVQRQTSSTRPATRKKAENFLRAFA